MENNPFDNPNLDPFQNIFLAIKILNDLGGKTDEDIKEIKSVILFVEKRLTAAEKKLSDFNISQN